MSLDGLHAATTEGQILLHIANSLDEINAKLQGPAPVEPAVDAPDASQVAGEPEKRPASTKPPVKKSASRKRVTGQ